MPRPTYICLPCQRLLLLQPRPLQKRLTHTRPHLPAPPHPPLTSGLINLSLSPSPSPSPTDPTPPPPPPRALLSLHGPDSTKFLQAVTTTNIPHLLTTPSRSAYTAFLSAQGRLLWEGFVYNVNSSRTWRERAGGVTVGGGGGGDGPTRRWGADDACWFIETSGGADGVDALRAWLGRYLLRSKVSIAPVATVRESPEDGWDIWASWGDPPPPPGGFSNSITAHDDRAPGLFTRFLVPRDAGEATATATLSDYNLRRFLHGIPESPSELLPPGRALPHEQNLDLYSPPHGLDFHKGCYVGQELTVRTQHRGVVRKRVVPVQLSPLAPATPVPPAHGGIVYDHTVALDLPPPAAEAEIISCHALPHESGRTRSAGRFITGIGNVGMALVRLESLFAHGWAGGVGTREGGRWGGEGFKLVWEEEMGGGEGGEVEGGVRKREVGLRAWMPGWHFRDVQGEGKEGEEGRGGNENV